MLHTATELFRAKGFHGVGLTELLTVSGAPKGSFYHHFPDGKEQLGVATLDFAGKAFGALIEQCFSSATSEREAIDRLMALIADHFEQSGYRAGCPVASIAIDAVPTSEQLTKAVQDVMEGWKAIVAKYAEGRGHSAKAADDFAERFAIALEGAWLLARIKQSKAPLMLVADMVTSN
jgi:TetR/AcrR family transcriptional regulator, lmrAB and yxaGH operons repressor